MKTFFFGLLFAGACGGGSGSGGTSGPSTAVGGCVIVGLYCYDYVGASWDVAAAQERCDLVNDDVVSGGYTASYDAAGCPSGATAECTGFDGIPGDPDSEIIIYYYQDPPMTVVENACTDGGGTYTLY